MRSHPRVALSAAALAVAVSMGVGGCAAPAAEAPHSIRIGISPDNLAQADLTNARTWVISVSTVYETLFKSFQEFGGFQPHLATGYELSDDWKSVTLTLREGVTFTDGEPFNAEALKTYLEGMAEVEHWSFKPKWDEVSPTLTVENDTTLTITAEEGMPPYNASFLGDLFGNVPIASPNVLDDLEAATAEPAGTGPYILESITPEVGASYVRNDDYWDPDAAPFETVDLIVFADDVAALNALTSGQVDAATVPRSSAAQAISQGLTINEPRLPGPGVMLIIADRNGVTNPAFADERVRQAMAFAFDREAINENLNQGYGRVSSQVFVETQPEYVPGGDDRYSYDPERARELMVEAGYADGFELVIPSQAGFSAWEPIVAQYLGDIGIRVTFETMEPAAWFDAAANSTEYPVSMFVLGLGFWNALPVAIDLLNPFKVTDPLVDELWPKAQVGPLAAASEARAQLGEYLLDQSILIQLATPDLLWATAPGYEVESDIGYPEMPLDFQLAD